MEYKVIKFSGHAIRRMFSRRISDRDVVETIRKGEIIERYPDDEPFPSCLICRSVKKQPLHVVVGYDDNTATAMVITVYKPGLDKWDDNFSRRKKQ